MQSEKRKMKKNKYGFTTIELLVAMAIFSALITIASGAFIRALRSQQTATNISEVNDNVNIVLDRIARDIKSGSGFLWDAATRDLKLVNAAGQTVHYRLTDSGLEFGIENESGEVIYTPLTAENIRITGFDINVAGVPPRLTVNLSASGFGRELENISTNIQTTVSTRGAAEGFVTQPSATEEEIVIPPALPEPEPEPETQPDTPTVSLSVSSSTIIQGQNTTLFWSSSNTTSCGAPWTSKTSVSGNEVINPSETATYQINCTGPGGEQSASVIVNVVLPPAVSLEANPSNVNAGSSTLLTWNSANVNNCTASSDPVSSDWNGVKSTSSQIGQTITPSATTTYSLTCIGDGGIASSSKVVSYVIPPGAITEPKTNVTIDYLFLPANSSPESFYGSVAIGQDGYPIIAYGRTDSYGLNDKWVKIVKCNDTSCGSKDVSELYAYSGGNLVSAGRSVTPKIIIGSDGLPVILLKSTINNYLFLIKCGNVSCHTSFPSTLSASSNVINVIDNSGVVGNDYSIIIGSDNFPIISYYDSVNKDLKFVKCGNLTCSTKNITTVDSVGDVGISSSITVSNDNFAFIAYYDRTNSDLKVAKCSNTTCSSKTLTKVDTTNFTGGVPSVTIGQDGNPVIAYQDITNRKLKIAKCGNVSCSSGNTVSAIDQLGSGPFQTSIALGSDGLPVVAYQWGQGDTKLLKCGNAACTNGNTITTLKSVIDLNFGYYSLFMSIGRNGFPAILHYDYSRSNPRLVFTKCANDACL